MEPETYGSSSSTAYPPNGTTAPNSIHTINYETRSSSRRHQSKKRSNEQNPTGPPATANDNGEERIEVKILPQDDNWGETTTITCHGGNEDTLTNNNDTSLQLNEQPDDNCQRLSKNSHLRGGSLSISNYLIYLICLIALISPLFFLSLPYLLLRTNSIVIDDYSPMFTIIFKLIFLMFGSVILLYRRRSASHLPRIHPQKTFLVVLLSAIIVVYWFYYIFKLMQPKVERYQRILSFTSTYEDLLISLFFLTVLILEMKWLYPKWIVKVVRSPDGQTRQYSIGSVSIQEAGVYLLEQYYKDFPVFNPWLENAQQTQAKRSGAYSSKSVGSQSNSSTIAGGENGTSARSMRGFNDRYRFFSQVL